MTAISVADNGILREWYTARELAELKLTGLPQSDRKSLIRFAERHDWQSTSLARKRSGRGGGWEYHIDLLPEAARSELQKRITLERHKADNSLVQSKRAIAVQNQQAFNARQRVMMEARAALLVEIERRSIISGLSRRKAILQFLEDLNLYRAGLPTSDEHSKDKTDYAALSEAVELAAERRNSLSLRSVYGWFSARDEGGVTALAPQIKKKTKSLAEVEWFGEFLKFYARPSKPSIAQALGDYIETLEDKSFAPSYKQVRTALCKLGNVDRVRGREGALTIKARMAYVSRSTEGLMPTSIYTADGKTFDAEVAHLLTGQPFRPEITSVLDVFTRRCVGFSVSLKENVIAVSDALRRASVEHGIPAIFYVDNGPGYRNKTFDADATGMMGRLGISKMHSIAYNSQARGIIERFHGSVWNPLAKSYVTYVGRDMDKEARKKAFDVTRREVKEFGRSRILIEWDAFLADCEKAVEQYNDKPHSELPKIADPITGKKRHMSPNEFWHAQTAKGFEPVSVQPYEIDDLFRPHEIRTARRCLIEWNTNKYFHQDLEQYHGDKVIVAYDIKDASKLWVREIDEVDGELLPGRLICVAEFAGNEERYVSVSYEQTAIEKRARAQKRRLSDKMDKVEDQLRSDLMLELNPAENINVLDGLSSIEHEPEPVVELIKPQSSVSTEPARPRKRIFGSDEELASWVIEHPEDLTPSRKKVLSGCLQRSTSLELFRLKGVDVEALRNVLRTAA
ncbi:putative transposase [Cohaesibacter sp. ES.047]|uniref:Mu transposase C-terminal domain-containing protein n=1 Tax=Cohaesibacter sp. ES.047 TaxID=1798205 RepID=UPI000BC074C9|nr:Mu transposase C-terminal domain-containing protein [Cohaesibacter sp. ES.047]SNY91421.1 putative transposase [Cohaesibacter sp. ES.047]